MTTLPYSLLKQTGDINPTKFSAPSDPYRVSNLLHPYFKIWFSLRLDLQAFHDFQRSLLDNSHMKRS